MSRRYFIFLVTISLMAVGAAGFLIYKYQTKIFREITSVFGGQNNLKLDFSLVPKSLNTNGTSTQSEIDQLRREVEALKKQPSAVALTFASPSPAPDLKTQEALSSANQKISSLEKQLQQLQAQSGQTPFAGGDANLIQTWKASEKVVQIACENKSLGAWQLGSGVLISSDGKILTNQHVAQLSSGQTPDYCLVLFSGDYDTASQSYKREYRAVVAGYFSGRDAALLKVQDVIYQDAGGQTQNAPILNSFQFFRSAVGQPQIGDPVYIVGFPESAKFNFSVTKGIISNLTSGDIYFGTDAQIDRGNSGGAAINSAGQLIGLPTYKYVGSGDYRGYILDIHSLNLN
ncbi:MAG: trypsin-like peptidase domain-containing protein [Candidatus Portnoybacteria bacterium]|nr:trypsin-like peptidase domain-containing protein [Candidatus Portnoybacteria bacterium]MDD4982946.1 trypsin-like peptidase domain-containing protein [Candidatus Portnoybacteria bacterium]